MRSILQCICLLCSTSVFAQGGWIKDTNPLNDAALYTAIYNYVGVSFVELNGDVFPDLLVSPKTVFINNGDGTFTESDPLPFTLMNGVSGNSASDLDNDGDNDVVVACVPSSVFFNDGTGVFTDMSASVPDFDTYGSWAVAIGNMNNDRGLDFAFAHAAGYHAPATSEPCRVYVQQISGFDPISISVPPITDELNPYTNPYWSDYDLDGDMDLFMASGPVMGIPDFDFCFINMKIETGADSLQLMTEELFAAQTQDGQCYNFIDFDNDQDLDLCLTNYYSASTRLYQNNDGEYTVVATPFSTTTTNIANCWGDYDNDGDQDVIITNDNQKTRYYRNNGDATFSYLASGFTTPTATNGITNGDFDNDGDLDLFTNGLGNNGNTSSVGLFINDTVAANRGFISFSLKGVTSNRSALGAIVKLKATINGIPTWQMREINAQNTFQGQNDLRVHFGLGNAFSVDSLIIMWPAGHVEMFTGILANAFYAVTEGEGLQNLSAQNAPLLESFRVYPNPVAQMLHVRFNSQMHKTHTWQIMDVQGRNLLTGSFQAQQLDIQMTTLPEGVYVLVISDGVSLSSKTIIKHN